MWQNGLVRAERSGARVGVPHKGAGAKLAAEHIGSAFATLVHGHHGGLPDRHRIREELLTLSGDGPDAQAAEEAVTAVRAMVPEVVPPQRLPLPGWLGEGRRDQMALELDMLSRMLFSTLVDADFLDTAAHFAGASPQVAPDADMRRLSERFEGRRQAFLARRERSELDAVREDVYQQALAAAARAPGLYRLHVPTGGGKTLASAGFALRHAAEHGKRRVVVAVPFISITEQNAQVYRRMMDPAGGESGGPVVLEHHSSVELDDTGAGRWARLAAENWDAPFVVTTTVQLFHSLFAHRPSAMRKLHRLAGSVIVLDEVQALPDRLLAPILSSLRSLVDRFGATVVLASATQPEFWSHPELEGMSRLEMVDDVERLFQRLKRVDYAWRLEADLSWEVLASEITAEPERQVLAVVNTTADAARLHRAVEEAVPDRDAPRVLHLSTRMTAGHRREVIATIRQLLDSGQATLVVSTSLIEAGVDLDFPCVYRAVTSAESLQQAAGRCNREGRLKAGRVVVFNPAEGGEPRDKAYRAAREATSLYFGPDLNRPDDLGALSAYYLERYSAQGSDGRAFGKAIQDARRDLDFPQVAADFQMIEQDHTSPVVVIRPEVSEEDREQARKDIGRLRGDFPTGPDVLRRLQPHTAALPRPEVHAAVNAGLAEPITGDLVEWLGNYDEDRGLDRDEPEDRTQFTL